MRELNPHDLNWIVRKTPKIVKDALQNTPSKLFVAGGFIRSIIMQEQPVDIDLFTSTREDGRVLASKLGIDGHFIVTENAFTILNWKKDFPAKYPIQIIHRWTFDNPTAMLQSFDFSIATAGFWFDGDNWTSMCSDTFYEDLAAKRLTYLKPIRNEDAGGSILRVLKFYQKGFRIPLADLGAVIGRLMASVKEHEILRSAERHDTTREEQIARVVTGLLREVDPNIEVNEMAETKE